MDVLFVSTACSKRLLGCVFQKKISVYGVQGQQFMNLLIKGLSENTQVDLNVLSKYSNRKYLNKKCFYKEEQETENDIKYTYLPESRIAGNLFSLWFILIYVFKWRLKHKKGYIICDGLNFSVLFSTLFSSWILSTKVTCVVTDMPRFLFVLPKGLKKKLSIWFVRLWEALIGRCDSFIVLTCDMNNVLNKRNKPFVVIEGLIDADRIIEGIGRQKKKVCLYTGSIMRIYGIDKLVYAFAKSNCTDYELHIYGGGDFEKELNELSKKYENIKYKGWLSNDQITAIQAESALLINPRPSEDEYTRYSFPSKTMEYMLSGTPVLTTRLPCIPEEYFEYLYFFDKETVDDMARTIARILTGDEAERLKRAEKARKFVLTYKNQRIQAGEIVVMLNSQN